jgi:hypothetical protein
VTDHPLRPATRRRLGRPPPHQQADRPRAHPQPNPQKREPFPPPHMRRKVISGIRPSFPGLSQSQGQVTHVLLTRSPLEHPKRAFPHDLHVLSTPPAFVLSQDQTLQQGTHTNNPQHPHPPQQQEGKNTRKPPARKPKKRTKPQHAPTPPNHRKRQKQKKPKEPKPQPPQKTGRPQPGTKRTGSFKHAVEFSKNGHPPPKPAPANPNGATQ